MRLLMDTVEIGEMFAQGVRLHQAGHRGRAADEEKVEEEKVSGRRKGEEEKVSGTNGIVYGFFPAFRDGRSLLAQH